MANETKNKLLGMNFSTASAKLKKLLMFDMMIQLGLDNCFQCGSKIQGAEVLSVEHKEPWQSSLSPKDSFFNLDNIAFSHLSCNSAAGLKKVCRHNKNNCKECVAVSRKKFREANREQDKREYRRSHGWVA